MKTSKRPGLAALTGILALTAWIGVSALTPVTSARSVSKVSAEASNAFSLALYRDLADQEIHRGRNLFVSPLGARFAMAMAYAGARGRTADEIKAALRFGAAPDRIGAEIGSQARGLEAEQGADGFELAIANGTWRQAASGWRESYLATLQDDFGAQSEAVDFGDAGERAEAADQINAWVARKTRQRITSIVSRSDLDPELGLLLINAIYFLGEWQYPFHNPGEAVSRSAPFTTLTKGVVNADFMNFEAARSGLRYYEDERLQAVELPYKAESAGQRLAMTVLLPRPGVDFAAFEAGLSDESLQELLSDMRQMRAQDGVRLQVRMPRWQFKPETMDLGDALQRLGIREAFTRGQADFAGISEKSKLWIGKVAQKTFVKVDEKGTEAAAVTAVMMVRATSVQPPFEVKYFNAERPFIYLIRQPQSGAILFIGRMADPTDEGEA